MRIGPEGNVYVFHRRFKVVLGDPNVAPGHSDGLSANCFGRWAVHPPILKFAPTVIFTWRMARVPITASSCFRADGTYTGEWGTTGSGPGQFNTPHDIAIDSRGRVFVGDRGNSRVQIFEADGTFIEQWRNFGRPSGIFINRETDTLYVTDSTSNSTNNPGVKRGIYIGSARNGEVNYFIPDPDLELADLTRISGASGITASADDAVIYAADVAPRQLRKYMRE